MRRFFMMAMAGVLLLASTAAADPLPGPDLQLYWPMDGLSGSTLTDNSGWDRHGTLTNGNGMMPWGTFGFVASDAPSSWGTLGNALDFGAISAYYDKLWLQSATDGGAYAAVDYQLPESGTIAMWYKTDPTFMYDSQTIFDNSGTDPTRPEQDWKMWIDSDATIWWEPTGMKVDPNPCLPPQPHFSLVDNGGGTATDYCNTWLHLAASWQRLTSDPVYVWDQIEEEWALYSEHGLVQTNLYVNGELVDMTPLGTDPNSTDDLAYPYQTPGDTFYLGGGNYTYIEELDEWRGNTHGLGMWDDVVIFDRMLSESEIQDLMNSVSPPPPPPLGDFNWDYVVDEADAAIIALHWRQNVSSWQDGDANEDGMVDERDASILASHWGTDWRNLHEHSAPPVPEPSALSLLVAAAATLAMAVRVNRRRAQ